jgi:hypothetical protein
LRLSGPRYDCSQNPKSSSVARAAVPGGVQDAWDERKEIFECVARRHDDEDTESCAAEILLELEILISREQDLETLCGCTTQEFAVRDASPTLLLHGSDVMTGQLACELTRELLIEQDAHRRLEPRAQLREQRWPAPVKRTGSVEKFAQAVAAFQVVDEVA